MFGFMNFRLFATLLTELAKNPELIKNLRSVQRIFTRKNRKRKRGGFIGLLLAAIGASIAASAATAGTAIAATAATVGSAVASSAVASAVVTGAVGAAAGIAVDQIAKAIDD